MYILEKISDKEASIINNLHSKQLKMKARGPDSYYKNGSFIFSNEDGIFYSSETKEKMNDDIMKLISKLKEFQISLEALKDKIERL